MFQTNLFNHRCLPFLHSQNIFNNSKTVTDEWPMISKEDFHVKIKTAKVIHLKKTILFDFSTTIAFLEKLKGQPDFIFLEGISENLKNNKYSYLGWDPYIKIGVTEAGITVDYLTGKKQETKENLYDFLASVLLNYSLPQNSEEKFYCGLMGVLNYETVEYLEEIKFKNKSELNTPLAQFIIPRNLIVFDNDLNTATVIRNVFQEEVEKKDLEEVYKNEQKELKNIIARIIAPTEGAINLIEYGERLDTDGGDVVFNLSKDEYFKAVKKCQDYIQSGHIFQIQISIRAKTKLKVSPLSLYRYLRNHNPSPFLFFSRLDGNYLLGSSPEVLVGVENRIVTIRPLAGTRKRKSARQTEEQIIEELLNDEKEKAEHLMLVDLARNDLGRACSNGSVNVNEFMFIEKYKHLFHIVSDVSGELKPGFTSVDALKYGYPAGTVTGTPKIRAIEIIEELETVRREFYSGGVVFFDFQDNLKSTLIIRSLFIDKEENVYTQAAAGIVADSTPENEYNEIKTKMMSSLMAMTVQEEKL